MFWLLFSLAVNLRPPQREAQEGVLPNKTGSGFSFVLKKANQLMIILFVFAFRKQTRIVAVLKSGAISTPWVLC